jgi:DNA replication protein DnaC
VYLYGDFGIGKSFFTQAIANYFASKNKTVAYINNNDLASYLKQLFSTGYKKTIDDLKNVDYLFIDDIGSEKNSS